MIKKRAIFLIKVDFFYAQGKARFFVRIVQRGEVSLSSFFT